jgi:molybdate transport system regulatory protein
LPAAPSIRFRIDFAENSNIGPGKIGLLEGIQTAGSLSAAARNLGLSYRRAWLLLDSLNESFDQPVTINTTGGPGGGGVVVTEFGLSLIRRYRELESEIAVIAQRCLGDILPRTATRSGPSKRVIKRVSLVKKRRKSAVGARQLSNNQTRR